MFAHFDCTPAQLTEEQLREYFLYLANERKVSRPTATIALCGIKFFYQRTLQRDWDHSGACPATSGEETTRRLEPGGSAPDSGGDPTLPSIAPV